MILIDILANLSTRLLQQVFIEKSLEKMEPLADKSESEASLRRRRGAKLLTYAETCKNEMRSSQKRPTASFVNVKESGIDIDLKPILHRRRHGP